MTICCLLVVKTYDRHLKDTFTQRFGRFAPDHIAHMENTIGHPDSTIADIVVMPEGFAAAMRDFQRFCVDPEVTR